MIVHNLGEGIAIALDAIRANKLRSSLTILGVVIGVTTVMAVASLVQGIRTPDLQRDRGRRPHRRSTSSAIFSQTPVNPDRLPYEVRIRPVLQPTDAAALARLPEIRYAGMWVQVFQKIEYQGERTQQVVTSSGPTRTTWTYRAAPCSGAGCSAGPS